jgi:hypothetical protein
MLAFVLDDIFINGQKPVAMILIAYDYRGYNVH